MISALLNNRTLVIFTVLLTVALILIVLIPISDPSEEPESTSALLPQDKNKGRIGSPTSVPSTADIDTAWRTGLFRPANPREEKPLADATIQKIKSQLKLQCVMELNKEQVAYINVAGIGLKKCKTGESVQDLFTVTRIDKTSVEITIIGHPVTLEL